MIHLYGSPLLLLILIIYQTTSKERQSETLKLFFTEYTHLTKLGIATPQSSYSSLASHSFLILVSGIGLFIFDYFTSFRKLPFSLWFALYFPGIVINVYFLACSVYLTIYKLLLEIVNEKLEQYSCKQMSCIELFNLRKNNVRPIELLKRFPNSQLNFLDHVLDKLMKLFFRFL